MHYIGKALEIRLAVTVVSMIVSIAAIVSMSGCMYPGMDKPAQLGEAYQNMLSEQTAYPDNAEKYGGKIVSSTDSERATLILDNHRSNINKSNKVDRPIVVNIGK